MRMYRGGEVHAPPSRRVVALDAELLHWRSLYLITAMDHLSLDTQSQKLLELGEAGLYASSSQRLQPLQLSDFTSVLQLILANMEFG